MRIQDTLSNSERKLDTAQRVRIYVCGVTTYDDSHIGHARTVIVFDVLKRHLEGKGIRVDLVQNFTDIDDKIIRKAGEQNTAAEKISEKYIQSYFEDFDGLNVRRATSYPRATDHIPDIIKFIETLVEKQAAYASRNGVYFSVSRFPGYGKLSKKRVEDLESGARVEVDEAKKDPLDFAVWKFSDAEPAWDSPWGRGRPGWHIECSVMSLKHLGENFEIHGGGRDLIFPHHENEIAQSESCTGSQFAKIWMHVGMVTISGEKMSKSLGNIRSIKHVLERWGPNVIRLFCLSGHYSKPIDYSEELLRENLTRWRQVETCHFELIHASGPNREDVTHTIRRLGDEFDAALEDDMDTHLALSSFFQVVKEANRLAAREILGKGDAQIIRVELQRMLEVLGLEIPEMTEAQRREIDGLVASRERLRQDRQFERADEIRDRLGKMGIELVDHRGKTTWMKKERILAED